jgi:competence protein ComEA
VVERTPLRPASLLAAVAAVVAAAVVGWWLLRPAAPPTESIVPLASAADATAPAVSAMPGSDGVVAPAGAASSTSTTVAPQVVVQAAGAVERPGLYRLSVGARVDDLIREAGGLTDRADRARINLAAAVNDGERIWFPARGEADPPEVVQATPGSSVAGPSASSEASDPARGAAAPVDLNSADAAALDELPGVGPATAEAIIAHREASGPFSSVDELLDVRGIGEAKLEQLRPLVRV